MFLSGLDELDQKILALLVENARYSYSEIGEKLGYSRVAIKNHVDALEKRGVIEGYTTIINPQKLGLRPSLRPSRRLPGSFRPVQSSPKSTGPRETAVFMSMQSPLARRSWTACFRRRWTRFQAWSP